MSNFSENIDNVIMEVMEDIIVAVVSDLGERQIEATVQSVLQDIVAMEFGYGEHLHLDTGTDNIDKDGRMVAIVDQLVDAMVLLVSESLSSVPNVQPEDASLNGKDVLWPVDEEDTANGGVIEVVEDDQIPAEGSFEESEEVLDGKLESGVQPAIHAVTPRGRIRRFAAAAWRGVKRAGRVVICLGCN